MIRYNVYTSLFLIALFLKYAKCISDPILQFLLAGLQEPKLASAAATSVQSISTTCKGKMRDHFQGLLNIAQAIDTLHLSNEAIIGFLKGMNICHVCVVINIAQAINTTSF